MEILIDEDRDQIGAEKPFLRVSLYTLSVTTKQQTFDLEINAQLSDFIIFHEQFTDKENHQLRLISAEFEEENSEEQKILISLYFHHRPKESAAFLSDGFDVENEIRLTINKLLIILKLEALLSIFTFQDSLMKSLIKETTTVEQKKIEDDKSKAAATAPRMGEQQFKSQFV